MRRIQPAVLTAVVALSAMWWIGNGDISEARVRRVRLQVLVPAAGINQRWIDEAPGGPSAGDWSLWKSRATLVAGCKNAGSILGRSTLVTISGSSQDLIADAGLSTPRGKLMVYLVGRVSDLNKPVGLTGAVTGGTGRYRDATGQVSVVSGASRCNKKGRLWSFDLVLSADGGSSEPGPTQTVTVTPTPSPTMVPTPTPSPSVTPVF